MKTITFFNTEEELQELTKLNHEQLLENNFDLIDWHWGFVSNERWNLYDSNSSYEFWLLNHMHSYCTSYRIIKYNDKYYYMFYQE